MAGLGSSETEGLATALVNRLRWTALLSALFGMLALAPQAAADPFGTTSLQSRPSGLAPVPPGTANDSVSSSSGISDDGRYVVFLSRSDNLVAGGGDGFQHAFVRDMQSNTLELIDRATDTIGHAGALGHGKTREGHAHVAFVNGHFARRARFGQRAAKSEVRRCHADEHRCA